MSYIYRLMPTGEVSSENEEPLHQKHGRQISLDGSPTDVLHIKFKGSGQHSRKWEPTDGAFTEEGSDLSEESIRAPLEPLAPADGRYWADLSPSERRRFYYEDEKREISYEAGTIWRMFKNDPLSPVRAYFHDYAITGVGLFLEGWVIFSISNNSTLFKQAYRSCWSSFTDCNETWTEATSYLQLIGILLGQLWFGFMGDWIGRRYTMLTDLGITLLGLVMLTVANGTTINGWVIMYAVSQFVFGFGIGGEYPMTSTRATEETESGRMRGQRHRGRKVMLAYTMQGWGQFCNLATLILLFLIFNSTGNPPPERRGRRVDYSHAAAGATWRVAFAVLIPLVLYVIYYRIWVLRELQALSNAKKKAGVSGYDWRSGRLLMTNFWHRLFGTAGIWFCNDWYFYGNGVFRSTFVGILAGPGASVLTNWLYSFINAGVQLFGYYFAALSVDFKPWGRRRMTTFSFIMVAAIFLCVAGAYDKLSQKQHIHWFQFLYYFSSFWGLFGSHTTSFLLAAESYPAQVRSTAHGISAAWGKVGSIGVTVWFNYASTRNKFWITWPVALIGAFITWFFIADTTGLDLAEQDRRWQYIYAGRAEDYHGPAVHPRHLSLWEKWVLKLHRQYNPDADRKQIAELGMLTGAEKGGLPESAYSLMKQSQQLQAENKNAALAENGKVTKV